MHVDHNAAFLEESAGLGGLAVEEGAIRLLGFVFLLAGDRFPEIVSSHYVSDFTFTCDKVVENIRNGEIKGA